MNALEGHLADYLVMRRALGYKLERAGQLLPQLVSFLEAAGAATVTAELAIAWAGLPASASAQHRAQRLAIARGFAAYLHTVDPAAEVPPSGVFPARRFRPAPYIWSEADVCTLIEQAGALRPRIRAATHATLFGLLAATGMRLGEAIGLEKDDVDLGQGLITIRHAKYDRARLVPVHDTVTQALGRYADERDRLCRRPRAQTFFLTSAGTALGRSGVEKVIRQLTCAMGIRTATCRPRAHDLRHRFAIATLIAWHQSGLDVDQHIAVLSTYLGHVAPSDTYWYLSATPELMTLAARRLGEAPRRKPMSALAPSLQAYFTKRLIGQRAASPSTVASYRLTFRLLLAFASKTSGKAPSSLDIDDLDAPLIASFLDHLEHDRHNSVATRNNRLAAVHSLFGYLALHHPEHAATIARVLAVPPKRTKRNLVTYLTDAEAEALLAACGTTSWTRRRDHAMFSLAIQTGLRISELAGLTRSDIVTGPGANVRTIGKGRKERRTPLIPSIVAVLKAWLREQPGTPDDPLFPTSTGRHLSRDAIEHRLALYISAAAHNYPSLKAKRVTTHTLRHTAAMRLLAAGNDITVIALWLGHEQVATTQIYLHADLTHKQRAIERTRPLRVKPGRFQPSDALLAFLEAL